MEEDKDDVFLEKSDDIIEELRQFYEIEDLDKGEQNAEGLPQKMFRWLVCGPSGCGKTNHIIKLLLRNELKHDKLYIFARDVFETKYATIAAHYAHMAEQAGVDVGDILEIGNTAEMIVHPDDLDKSISNLVIFDDFVANKEADKIIAEHFLRGRKQNTNYIYITQSFYGTPKVIRINCNYFSCYRLGSPKELRLIYSDTSATMTPEEFKAKYDEAVSEPYGFYFAHMNME